MSRYDSRSADPSSYRGRSDSGFGGASGYGSSVRSSSSKRDYDVVEPPRKLDLDGLIPFEKNFYVESTSVAAMLENEVEESIDYKGKSQLKAEMFPNLSSVSNVGFPGTSIWIFEKFLYVCFLAIAISICLFSY
ncbi:hypothetical protein QYF36_017699 [Acer negundo]|nr:hypothetical protein QYF36_017699 [Acer negundo]